MNDVQVNSGRARNIFVVKVGGQIRLNKKIELFAQIGGSLGEPLNPRLWWQYWIKSKMVNWFTQKYY